MSLMIKGEANIIPYNCAYTSVADIGDGFVDFSWTKITIALDWFDGDLSNKSIPIGAAATDIDLLNGTLFTIWMIPY